MSRLKRLGWELKAVRHMSLYLGKYWHDENGVIMFHESSWLVGLMQLEALECTTVK